MKHSFEHKNTYVFSSYWIVSVLLEEILNSYTEKFIYYLLYYAF